MEKIKRIVLWAIVTSLVSAAVAEPVTRNGTRVLHYSTRNALIADGDTNAGGSLRLDYKQQGAALKQTFTLDAVRLEPTNSYWLAAAVGNDTNGVVVSTNRTDRRGHLRANFSLRGQGTHVRGSLPELLNPLTDLRAVTVVDANTQTVAHAWIDEATSFQYLLKRNLVAEDGGSARGAISLSSNGHRVGFRLVAGGLDAASACYLAFDSNIVSTATSTASGRATFTEWPTNAAALLAPHLLQVLDASSNVVLSTTLPK